VTSGTSTIVVPVTETHTVTRTIVTVVPTGTSTPSNPPPEKGGNPPPSGGNPPPEKGGSNPPAQGGSNPPAQGGSSPTKSSTPPVFTGAAAGIVNQQPVAGLMVAALGAFALL
jgi:hypothetical protein